VKRLQDIAIELGFDEGLMRHAARLARSAPEREINVDERRRTQRVLGAEPLARRRRPPLAAVFAGTALVVVVAAGAYALRPDDAPGELRVGDVEHHVTQLPPSTATTTTPATTTPATTTPATTTPATTTTPPSTTLAATLPGLPHIGAVSTAKDVGEKATATGTSATGTSATTAKKLEPKGTVREVKLAAAATAATTARTSASTNGNATAANGANGANGAKSVGGFGRLSVNSEPWAQVWIDGKLVKAETPATNMTLPAGRHVLRLVNPTFKLEKILDVDVAPDSDTKKIVDLNR
jgi:hypothetical protein